MTLHLTCAFELIMMPNKRVIAFFHHFFLQFVHIAEIGQTTHNTKTSRPPVPCISPIFTIFNLCSSRARMGQKVNNIHKVRQAMVKIQRGADGNHPYPLARHVGRNGLAIGGLV